MRYIDTSVLMAFLLPESGSQLAERLMTSPGDALAFSSWTEVELLSALGIQVRRKAITRRGARKVVDAFANLVAPALVRLAVDDNDHRMAAYMLDGWQTGLRAGDALHLAMVQAYQAERWTFDQTMSKAASHFGLRCQLLRS
ncbi:type II toxin-antitoxin system VapC family toxin [Rugamonas aquatica]|uniref:PIN domain-containing protein n=1 Tax=Rugamonas aquatica TaxID=2743357 RepID=A0A6A7MZE9_9BURK|nr:type II toxin-antitoxin system VapC family toxin [Rugamonas aquatica]MQA38149.1 PIN domain-containing protein [Rugamonas aquatica]